MAMTPSAQVDGARRRSLTRRLWADLTRTKRRWTWGLLALVLPLMLPVSVLAQTDGASPPKAAEPQRDISVDLTDLNRIDLGKLQFGSTCAAYCHGSEGRGGRAPAFLGRSDFDPHNAYRVIRDGRRGAGGVMPPFGQAFSETQIWELVAYLQHLALQPAKP